MARTLDAAPGPALAAESARGEPSIDVSCTQRVTDPDDVAITRRTGANRLAAVRRLPRGRRRLARPKTGKRNLAMIP